VEAVHAQRPEFYKYKSFDGLEIEAALLKPTGYDGKSKLPLIALIHGGPTGAWQDSIEAWGSSLRRAATRSFVPIFADRTVTARNSSR